MKLPPQPYIIIGIIILKKSKITKQNGRGAKPKMPLKENKELLIIILGLILTITIYGAIIGLPLIAIGAYLLNKKAKNPLQTEIDEVNKELREKEQIIQRTNRS